MSARVLQNPAGGRRPLKRPRLGSQQRLLNRQELQRENQQLREENERLRREVAESEQRIADQEKQIADLERQLAGRASRRAAIETGALPGPAQAGRTKGPSRPPPGVAAARTGR